MITFIGDHRKAKAVDPVGKVSLAVLVYHSGRGRIGGAEGKSVNRHDCGHLGNIEEYN